MEGLRGRRGGIENGEAGVSQRNIPLNEFPLGIWSSKFQRFDRSVQPPEEVLSLLGESVCPSYSAHFNYRIGVSDN